jgi:hypothetical protein
MTQRAGTRPAGVLCVRGGVVFTKFNQGAAKLRFGIARPFGCEEQETQRDARVGELTLQTRLSGKVGSTVVERADSSLVLPLGVELFSTQHEQVTKLVERLAQQIAVFRLGRDFGDQRLQKLDGSAAVLLDLAAPVHVFVEQFRLLHDVGSIHACAQLPVQPQAY